jgi:signal transduction histidine kinase
VGTTILALIGGLIVCAIADFVSTDHLYGSIDSRLTSRLTSLVRESPSKSESKSSATSPSPSGSDSGDVDDAPILAWFVPNGSTSAQLLGTTTAELPKSFIHVTRPTSTVINGRGFRLEGVTSASGRFIVGTSNEEVGAVLATLLTIQGVLAPIALLMLFVAATIIGRRSSTPIERARVRQLEFTADASHELRTPLSVIQAEVSLALSSTRSLSEYQLVLERISGESERLRHIVDDLLWLARLDSLPVGPRHEPIDAVAVVHNCAERFTAVAGQRGIAISVIDSSVTAPIVVVPVDWLDRLVAVLLDNACRYSNEDGHIEILVGVSGDRVTLIFDDDGPGFEKREREHLLGRFHRASAIPGGAGLGLAIASAVVQATNGKIVLGAAPLGGARVEVSWPQFH